MNSKLIALVTGWLAALYQHAGRHVARYVRHRIRQQMRQARTRAERYVRDHAWGHAHGHTLLDDHMLQDIGLRSVDARTLGRMGIHRIDDKNPCTGIRGLVRPTTF